MGLPLSNPALPSALDKKSFSNVSSHAVF
jgi:hypothetical protein